MTMTKAQFVAKIKPSALKIARETGILPSIIIAQAALESQWGLSSPGNMLFGVKAFSTWRGKKQLLWTHEVYNGIRVRVQAWFRAYDSWYDSLADHAKLLQGSRYKKVIAAKDFRDAARALQSCGYATDPEYATKLINMIQTRNWHLIDKELGEHDMEQVRVVINGNKSVDGYFENNRAYPPASVLKELGLNVKWDNANKVLYLSNTK